MSSLFSAENELTLTQFEDEVAGAEDFWVLGPTDLGYQYRGEKRCHILKLETANVPPKFPVQEEFEKRSDYLNAVNRYYEDAQRPRMFLDCQPETMNRFSKGKFEHRVPKRIFEFDFDNIAEWVNSQTKGGWSVEVYAHRSRRKGQSFLLFYFEDKEAAALFKMFNL